MGYLRLGLTSFWVGPWVLFRKGYYFYPHNCVLVGVFSVFFSFLTPLGRLHDIYGDYKYTYWACGIVLIFAGIYLFIGMGINYRMTERKRSRQQEKESKEEEAGVQVETPKASTNTAESPEQKGTEGSPREEESPVWACGAEGYMEQLVTQDIWNVLLAVSPRGAQCRVDICVEILPCVPGWNVCFTPHHQSKSNIHILWEGVLAKIEGRRRVFFFFLILAFNSVMKIIICALSFSL